MGAREACALAVMVATLVASCDVAGAFAALLRGGDAIPWALDGMTALAVATVALAMLDEGRGRHGRR